MVAFALLAVLGVLARPLLPIDETRYLAVAWEMRLHGDWIVPKLNGAPYSHKPPLLFWLTNLVWSVTGVSGTAARLVAPAFGVAMIWATGRLARLLWPEEAGIGGRAAMVLAGLCGFAFYAGLTMFDTLLGLAVLGGVLSLQAAGDRPLGWIWLGVALAAGVFAKGPVVLVHLVPVALATPIWRGVRPATMARGLALALVVATGLVSLWLVPAILLGGPEYRDAVLWTQSAGRMTDAFAHARPWWFFLALLPALLWPFAWSAALWRRAAGLRPARDPGLRLALIWGGSALMLFSLMSGKQAHYLVPALPAAALLIARCMGAAPMSCRAATPPLALLGLACLAAGFGFAPRKLAPLMEPAGLFLFLGIGWLGLAILAWHARGIAIAWVGLGAPLLVNLAFLFGTVGQIYDPAPIAELIAPFDATGIAVMGEAYNGEFTFDARLRNPVTALRPEAADNWLIAAPDRVLIGRLGGTEPKFAPNVMIVYRNSAYAIWKSSDVAPLRMSDAARD